MPDRFSEEQKVARLVADIKTEVENLDKIFGKRLRDGNTMDIVVQNARGQVEAYREVITKIKFLWEV